MFMVPQITGMDSEFKALHFKTSNINYELVEAAANGDIDKVHHCLQHGANANFISRIEDNLNIEDLVFRSTALMRAAHNGHLQIVITLLHHLKTYDDGRKVQTYWTVLVETLRNSASRNSNTDGKLSVMDLENLNEFSLMSEHFQVLIYLVEAGVDVNSSLRNGMAPLMVAASNGSTATMQYLLEHGADVNLLIHTTNKGLNSALICAVKGRKKEAICLLLKSGSDMHSLPSKLALFIAISQGDMDIIKLLASYGARPVMIKAYDLYRINLIHLDDITMYSDRISPLYMALYSNHSAVAWYFLGIGFITDFDVKSLSKQMDLRYRLETDENCANALEILNLIKNKPMPLVIICFVKILDYLPQSKQVSQIVANLSIPQGMKKRLMFGKDEYLNVM